MLATAFNAEPTTAARRRVRPKVRATAPATTAPALATQATVAAAQATTPPLATVPTTTIVAGVPAARYRVFEPTTGKIVIGLEPPSRNDLRATITADAIGFVEESKQYDVPVGAADYTLVADLNPDTKYTFRARWNAPDGTVGPEDVKVIDPFFPQPKYRGPVPTGGNGWSVLFTSDFVPTRRNPCAPIEVFYDRKNEQSDQTLTVQSAIAQAAEASGVPMTFIGSGTTRPTKPRVLIIDWVTGPTNYLGVTRQAQVKDARGVVWRTTLSVSLAQSRRVASGRWETVILHELGHVLGLQHSHEPTSLMFSPSESNSAWPWVTKVFTEGDKAGLLAVNAKASGGCSPTIEPTDLWNGTPGP
jgi:Matrixin